MRCGYPDSHKVHAQQRIHCALFEVGLTAGNLLSPEPMFRHSVCSWNTLKEESPSIGQILLPVTIWSQERAKCKLVWVFRKGKVESPHINFYSCCSPASSCPPPTYQWNSGPWINEKVQVRERPTHLWKGLYAGLWEVAAGLGCWRFVVSASACV